MLLLLLLHAWRRVVKTSTQFQTLQRFAAFRPNVGIIGLVNLTERYVLPTPSTTTTPSIRSFASLFRQSSQEAQLSQRDGAMLDECH